MVNDNTPMRIVFSNLFAKLIDKHVLTVTDVQEILDASDDEMNAALDKVSEEKNTEYIRIGDDVYVRDEDGQGWHTIPAQELSKYSDTWKVAREGAPNGSVELVHEACGNHVICPRCDIPKFCARCGARMKGGDEK